MNQGQINHPFWCPWLHGENLEEKQKVLKPLSCKET
jgi:hypothetical protein